jgi:hypothetical protein
MNGMNLLKYKVWDKEKKIMYDATQVDIVNEMVSYWNHEKRYSSQGYDMPAIIIQFTGLKDVNDREAYYKDIVEYEGWIYVVEWDEADTGFYLADYRHLDDPLSEEHIIGSCITKGRIIGNTLANPELLNK